jgi:hypothetical protein
MRSRIARSRFHGRTPGIAKKPANEGASMPTDAPNEPVDSDSDATTTEDDLSEDQDSEPTNTAPAGERPMDNPSES